MADGKTRSVSVVFQAFTDKFTNKTKKAGTTIGGFAKKAIAIGGGFLAARAGLAQFRKAFEKLDEIGKLSDVLEVSPDFLRGLDLAATQTGSSFATAQKALSRFVRSVGEAKTGTGEGVQALEILNVQLKDIENLSTEDQFFKIANSLKGMEDPTLRAAAAAKLFGRSGQDLLNLFAEGEEGIKRFIEQQKELGGGISRDDIRKVEAANDAVDKMGRAWEGIIQQLAIEFAPLLQDMAEGMKELIKLADIFGSVWKNMQSDLEGVISDVFYGGKGKDITLGLRAIDKKAPAKIGPLKIASASIKSFSEAARAGSSKAFDLLNPNVTNSVANQTLKATEETNNILQAIRDEDGIKFEQVSI